MLDTYSSGETTANKQDSFPLIQLTSDLKDCADPHLDHCPEASLQEASEKTFYCLMVKTLNRDKLSRHNDTPWTRHFDLRGSRPVWRSLYKPSLTKRHLQRRILHRAMEDRCPFCTVCPFTVFLNVTNCLHRFCSCSVFTEVFTKGVFICGFKYAHQKKKNQLLNFVLGQAKTAVYVSRNRRVEG